VLVAKPKDFGFFGKGEGPDEGRYTPLQSAKAHERFRSDLARVIDLLIAGRHEDAASAAKRPEVPEIAALPAFTLTDLDGRPVARGDLAGRAVLVEFWATWCPPCRGTLGWLGELRRRYGDRLVVLALAIESDEKDVRRVASEAGTPLRWAMGTPEIARAFGDVSAMPTLLLFDGQGGRVASFFGAPPSLHGAVEAELERLLR
jgi:thiol-disulfide isomerase/thioredoxin